MNLICCIERFLHCTCLHAPKHKFCLSSKGFRNFTSIASVSWTLLHQDIIYNNIIIDVAAALIIVWCNKQIFDLIWFDLKLQ